MVAMRFVPAILGILLLGAHFLRGGHSLLAAGLAAYPFLLVLRSPWVKRGFEVLLRAGALVWLTTAARLAAARLETGQPWLRMACILGAVAGFNVLALRLLQSERISEYFFRRA